MASEHKTGGISTAHAWLLASLVIVVCSAISWALIFTLSAPKANSAADIAGIKNSLGHITDLLTGLNNFAGFQNMRLDDLGGQTQLKFTDADVQIAKINTTAAKTRSDLDAVGKFANDTKQSLDATIVALTTFATAVNENTVSLNGSLSNLKVRVDDNAATFNASLVTLNGKVTTNTASLNSSLDTLNTKLDGTAASLNASIDAVKAGADGATASLNASINTLTAGIEGANTATTTLTASLEALNAKVNGLTPGLAITPSATATSTGGTISLSIQSDTAQTIAFSILFRPTAPVALADATFEAALKALYATPPFTLTAGSAMRGDYSIYWNPTDSKYYLGSITFKTSATTLVAGSQSKDITYTGNTSYQMLITPLYVTGNTTTTW